MKKRTLLVLLILIVAVGMSYAQNAGEGRSFVLTLPYTAPPSAYTPPQVRLLVTSTLGADVQIRYPATGGTDAFTVPAAGSFELAIDSALVMLPQVEGRHRATIILQSSAPVSAVLMIDRDFSAEAYNAIPDSLLGVEYRSVSFESPDNGQFFAVVGVHDSTTVTITPAIASRGGRPAGVPFTVRLNRGEVYQYLSQLYIVGDLSGSHIVSDKPVGLLSGAVCMDFPIGGQHACNPLLEQLPSVDAWGREFVASPVVSDGGSLFRVVARCEATDIVINGKPAFRLNANESYAFRFDVGLHIVASQSILCVQYLTATIGGGADPRFATGDPSMTVLQPLDQWPLQGRIVTPSLSARDVGSGPVGWRHFLHVSIDSSAVGGLLIDGVPVVWNYTHSTGRWIIGGIALGVGDHLLTSTVPIGCITYGNSLQDAYAYPLSGRRGAWRLDASPLEGRVCVDSLDTTVVLRNNGTAPARVDSVVATGDLDAILLSPANPFTVPPGGSVQVRLRLRGLFRRQADGWLIFTGGVCRERLLVLKIGLAGSSLVLDRPTVRTIDFGGVPTTIPYVDTILVVRNPGRFPIELLPPVLSSPEMQILSPTFPLILAPGTYVVINLRYTPSSPTLTSGTITLRTADCPDSIVVDWRGHIQSGGYLSVTPSAPLRLLCGPKSVDSLSVSLHNQGDGSYDITALVVVGPASAEFGVLQPSTPVAVAPGDSTVVGIRYMPGPLGLRTAFLRVLSNALNGDTALIPFDVRNDTSLLAAEVDSLDLGTFSGCDPRPVGRFRLRNSGTTRLTGLRLATGPAGLINGMLESISDLDSARETEVSVAVVSDSVGTFSDSVAVGVNECAVPIVVRVTWSREASSLVVSPDTIDFGILEACDSLRDADVTIINRGRVVDTVEIFRLPISVSISVAAGIFPLVIQPGDTAVVRVAFKPTADGVVRDSLMIYSHRCRIPLTVHLVGRADLGRLGLSSGSINFGLVARGTTATGTVRISNPTGNLFTVDPLELTGGRTDLRVLRPTGPFVVVPGGFVDVDLEFAPNAQSPDTLSEELRVPRVGGRCPDTLRVRLTGETTRTGGITFRWQRDSAYVGDRGGLRLVVRWDSVHVVDESLEFFTLLSHDGSILLPDETVSTDGELSAVVVANRLSGNSRQIAIRGIGRLSDTGSTIVLGVLALLGEVESTPLRIDSVFVRSLRDSAVVTDVTRIDGSFHLLGVCDAGGRRRLVRVTDPSTIDRIRVGSHGADVDLTLGESGAFELEIMDHRGQRCRHLRFEESAPGQRRATVPVDNLAAGIYWLVLRTPSGGVHTAVLLR